MSHNTNTTATPTYNAVLVNRIDRVMLVMAVIMSAFLIFTGANAGNDAEATVPQMVNMGSTGGGGTLSGGIPALEVETDSHHSSGGTLNP